MGRRSIQSTCTNALSWADGGPPSPLFLGSFFGAGKGIEDMAQSSGRSGGVKGIGLVTIIFGIIFIVAGAVTWGSVATNLGNEKITVSDDASNFQGQLVDTPWEAWVQADIINHHALEASGGKTY